MKSFIQLVAEASVAEVPSIPEIENTNSFVHVGSTFSENDFSIGNEKDRIVEVTVIKKGWSKNGYYYTQEAIEDVANHINNAIATGAIAKKVYLNHNPRNDPFKPRGTEEWIALNQRAWVEGDEVKAEVKFLKSGPNAWVFDRVKEALGEFGPSIVGKAAMVKGTVEGQKGMIAKRVPYLHVYDFVDNPAAGGSTNAILQEGTFIDFDVEVEEGKLVDSVKKQEKRVENRQKMWRLEGVLSGMVYGLVEAEGDEYEHLSIDDRKSAVGEAIDEYKTEVLKLNFADPKKKPNTSTEKETSESHTVQEGENAMEINKLTLSELRGNPTVFEAVLQEATKTVEESAKVAKYKNDSEVVLPAKVQEVETLMAKVTAVEQERDKLADEKKALQEQIDKHNAEKVEFARTKAIAEVQKEVGLTDEQMSDTFQEDLSRLPFDADKADDFKAAVKTRMEERKSLVESKPGRKVVETKGNRQPADDKPEGKDILESKDLAAQLKG